MAMRQACLNVATALGYVRYKLLNQRENRRI